MAQLFSHFKHMQILQKLEPLKISPWDYKIAQFFLTRQLFVYYSAPDVPVSMVASYHCLDAERICMTSLALVKVYRPKCQPPIVQKLAKHDKIANCSCCLWAPQQLSHVLWHDVQGTLAKNSKLKKLEILRTCTPSQQYLEFTRIAALKLSQLYS